MADAESDPQPRPGRPPRRAVRRWWWAAPLLLLAALLLCEALGWPFLQGPLERALAAATTREVALGPGFSLHLLPRPRLAAERLRIGAPAQGPVLRDAQGRVQPFAEAQGIELSLPWSTAWALLRKDLRRDEPLQVRSLVVQRLELALLRDREGRANWRLRQPPPGEPPRPAAELPEFAHFVVRDGRLHVDDARSRLRLEVALRTEEGDAASAPQGGGRLHASAEGRWRDSPLKAELRTQGLLPIVSSQAGSPPVPFALQLSSGDSALHLEGRAADVLRLSGVDAAYRLEGPSLAALGDALDLTLPRTPAFAMQGQLRKEGAVWQTAVRELRLGESRLGGEFRYDPRGRVPLLSGKLAGERLALPDLGPAFGGDGATTKQSGQSAREANARAGGVLPQREFELPALAAMNADLDVDLASVHLGTGLIDHLAPLRAHLVLRDQVLSVQNLVARTAGGELRGALSLDARERQSPLWKADLRLGNVRLERFVKPRNPRASKAKGGPAPGYVSGALSAVAQLQGRGRSTAAMLASLDGSAKAWVRDGAISHLLLEMSGVDVAESLGLIIRSDDENLPLRCAVAQVAVRDGVVRPEVAVVDTVDTTLEIGGSLSLAKEQLDLVLRALPKDKTPVALRSPVHVQGTFAKPEVKLDMGRIGLRAAAAAALATVVNPVAGLLALIDLGEPEKAVCQKALARVQQRGGSR